MATVKLIQMFLKKPGKALKVLTGKKKPAFLVSYKLTTHLMMVMKAS